MDIQWSWWIQHGIRWTFLLTWVLILVFLIRVHRKLDQNDTRDEAILTCLTEWRAAAAASSIDTPKPPKDEPPVMMGMDFGLGALWWGLQKLLRMRAHHVNR